MKININGTEVTLKYGFRALMGYEKMVGETFAPKGLNEMVMLMYSMVVTSSYDIAISFDDFMDWLDENPNSLTEFSEYLLAQMTKYEDLNKKTEEEIKEAVDNADSNTKKK